MKVSKQRSKAQVQPNQNTTISISPLALSSRRQAPSLGVATAAMVQLLLPLSESEDARTV